MLNSIGIWVPIFLICSYNFGVDNIGQDIWALLGQVLLLVELLCHVNVVRVIPNVSIENSKRLVN